VEAAEQTSQASGSGEPQGVSADVDRAGVPAPGHDDQADVAHVRTFLPVLILKRAETQLSALGSSPPRSRWDDPAYDRRTQRSSLKHSPAAGGRVRATYGV